MKANEAPEKIYITNYDIEALPKDERLSERWHEVRTQDTDIEYTRTNVFIEKASAWLREQEEMVGVSFQDDFIKRFRDYMEGK